MADIRTLKLALLADTKNFIDGLDKADKETKTFTNKLDDALKVGAKAFLALGSAAATAALKIGVDSVQAAIEDDKAQRNLAKTLENVIGATKEQTKAVEDYITKQSISLGVSDDKLRPAYARLIRSTKDTTEAQKALNIALDISSATGKDLDSVATALGKAYDGNSASLGKLGLGIDSTILKSNDMQKITQELAKTFQGFAEQEANTLEGRFIRISIAINEAKETLGYALLPVVERFASFATDTLIPALDDFVAGLIGGTPNSVKNALRDAKGRVIEFNEGLELTANSGAYGLGIALNELGKTFADFSETLFGATNEESGLKKFLDLLTSITKGIENVINAYSRLPDIGKFLINPAPDLFRVGEAATNLAASAKQAVSNININVSGAVDPQGVARTVTKVLGTASKTTGIKVPASALRVAF